MRQCAVQSQQRDRSQHREKRDKLREASLDANVKPSFGHASEAPEQCEQTEREEKKREARRAKEEIAATMSEARRLLDENRDGNPAPPPTEAISVAETYKVRLAARDLRNSKLSAENAALHDQVAQLQRSLEEAQQAQKAAEKARVTVCPRACLSAVAAKF